MIAKAGHFMWFWGNGCTPFIAMDYNCAWRGPAVLSRQEAKSMLKFDRKQPLWSRAIAVILAVFLLTASGRGMIPGVCLTISAAEQAALADRVSFGGTLSAVRVCCIVRIREASSRSSEAPIPPPSGKCALCQLAKACVDFSPYFWRDLIRAPFAEMLPASTGGQMLPNPTLDSCPPRAPPAHST